MGPAIWLALARDELRAAELLGEHGIAPLSCLHADQAIEKALWALRLHREDGGYPPKVGEQTGDGSEDSPFLPNCRLPSTDYRLGGKRHGIAAALASLALHSAHQQPASEDPEAALAREAVQVAHRLVDRITERVYGDVKR